jgi:hypothetical protein
MAIYDPLNMPCDSNESGMEHWVDHLELQHQMLALTRSRARKEKQTTRTKQTRSKENAAKPVAYLKDSSMMARHRIYHQ